MSLAADVIKRFEGCRLKAYKDQGGVWTCGWGSTGPAIVEGTTWTQAQADAALEHYLSALLDVLEDAIHVPVSPAQFAACASLAYNVGTSAFLKSTVLHKINEKDFPAAADAFRLWTKVGGKVNQGLVNRREAERALFLRT